MSDKPKPPVSTTKPEAPKPPPPKPDPALVTYFERGPEDERKPA